MGGDWCYEYKFWSELLRLRLELDAHQQVATSQAKYSHPLSGVYLGQERPFAHSPRLHYLPWTATVTRRPKPPVGKSPGTNTGGGADWHQFGAMPSPIQVSEDLSLRMSAFICSVVFSTEQCDDVAVFRTIKIGSQDPWRQGTAIVIMLIWRCANDPSSSCLASPRLRTRRVRKLGVSLFTSQRHDEVYKYKEIETPITLTSRLDGLLGLLSRLPCFQACQRYLFGIVSLELKLNTATKHQHNGGGEDPGRPGKVDKVATDPASGMQKKHTRGAAAAE
ncbi:uncharacterized protein CLUP02_16490 [Colletotrichum lupini]|uniref:Uncharacterized protein n=1 Tax=Colletotrichum lupini TaxID=145971 RepID=A0A9Q8T819_9PEZI|nr:uncharacterized protein CLUP02_16490 [Colletotrichum lupini]UQC90958.1 hypothetical protein CLUP02_16490 [Colletotrichum lupini]